MAEEPTSPAPRRRFAPEPVETSVKKSRRFPIEPVETSTRSSKKEASTEDEAAGIGSVNGDGDKKMEGGTDVKDMASPPATPKRRFLPQPVETTSYKSSNRPATTLPIRETTTSSQASSNGPPVDAPVKRRFAPQLIETCKRTKRAGDVRPATLPTDKTDITPGTNHIYVERKHNRPRPSPPNGTGDLLSPPYPPRRQPSMRPHLNTRRSTRDEAFHPGLEPIESSESEPEDIDESTPSLSGSFGSSEDSMIKLQMARTRESCDDRFSGYLLALAAKAAEKQLREQALAGFPNQSEHEIVEHFYDREIDGASDEGSVVGIGLLGDDSDSLLEPTRRKSTEVGWAAKEMQKHQEELARLREQDINLKIAAEAEASAQTDPFWTNGVTEKNTAFARAQGGLNSEKEKELDRMRLAASPPMLGSDLKFRMCPSPKATKFESDQKHDVQLNRSNCGGGLWGGFCVAEEAGEYLSPSIVAPPLLQTPQVERSDPFSSAFGSEAPGSRSPTTSRPGTSHRSGVHLLSGIEERLQAQAAKSKLEEALFAEYNDEFVTQVYNYLSLGYPALARQYDEELSKISEVPLEDLQRRDSEKLVNGYIGLATPPSPSSKRAEPPSCMRWKALKLYILEWARQHPDMANGVLGPDAWGVRARRGSWAI